MAENQTLVATSMEAPYMLQRLYAVIVYYICDIKRI
jgi:hypothetical protein